MNMKICCSFLCRSPALLFLLLMYKRESGHKVWPLAIRQEKLIYPEENCCFLLLLLLLLIEFDGVCVELLFS